MNDKQMSAQQVAMQVLEMIRATHPDLIADNMPDGWGMNRLRSEMKTPRVLVVVSGGIAEPVFDAGVEVEVFDWDNYNDSPKDTGGVPALFADLAKPGDIPVEPGIFEVMAAGFDASSDETDDLVFWIKAPSEEAVKAAIKNTGATFGGLMDYTPSDGVDYELPRQEMQLSAALLEAESDYRNRNRVTP